jgi:hypothetical protein
MIRFWTLTWEEIERKWPGLKGIFGGELEEDLDDLLPTDRREPLRAKLT